MNFCKVSLISASLVALLASCNGAGGSKEANNEAGTQLTASGLNPENFISKNEDSGKETALYQLKNSNGMEVCITNFGGRIVSVMVPDKDGNFKDVVLGYDSIADYINKPSDFGAAIGRYANRINNGEMVIDGKKIDLPKNNFGHCLHGGPTGWQYQIYDVKSVNDSTITLVMNSPAGDNNFPGNVVAEVTYTLTNDNAIDIAYTATTDSTTVINMTNHSYFNLNGDPDQLITNNTLMVNSTSFTPVGKSLIPTGEIVTVKDTPFDFSTPKEIGKDIAADNEQVKYGNGFDHNWVLDTNGDITKEAAVLSSPVTGITLTVYTDEPGIQVYTGNFLDGKTSGKQGKVYNSRAAICLETQHYPDSPNKPQWPSVVLKPGETYNSHCIYKFGVEK